MEYKNDFIERKIQKVSLFLRKMFSNIVIGDDEVFSLQSFNEDLKAKLDFGFYELFSLNEENLKEKLKGINVSVLDGLLRVFYQISKKEMLTSNQVDLKRVSIILIYEIERESKVFSFERQEIKNYFKNQKIN